MAKKPTLEDPALGELRYEPKGWRGEIPRGGRSLVVRVQGARSGPAPEVLAAARAAVERIDQRERSAREFLARHADQSRADGFRDFPDVQTLALESVYAFVPDPEWARQQPQLSESGSPLSWQVPMTLLEFSIPGDINVLEVLFVGDVATTDDYH